MTVLARERVLEVLYSSEASVSDNEGGPVNCRRGGWLVLLLSLIQVTIVLADVVGRFDQRAADAEERPVKLVSVNVGLPQEVHWRGRTVRTSIWKTPVAGHVRVNPLNLEGDQQSDLSVHGGPEKAVYAYPFEHYEYWGREFPAMDLPRGVFGENFTIEGLLEEDVKIGDRLQVGSAEFLVTQPRMPCYKLGIRFGRDDMVKHFLGSGRTGFYLAVLREGEVARGDPIEFTGRSDHDITVADIAALYSHDADNQVLLRRAVELPALPESWRDYFRKRLWEADG